MAGRNPVPTRLKVLTGNPGKRPLTKKEPEPPRGIPDMPEWLREFPKAVEEWERECRILDGMGILTVAEEGLLASRCYLSAQIQAIAVDLKREGRVVYVSRMDSVGNEIMEAKANPKAVQLKSMMTEYRQTGSLLGFDPVSRAKMATEPTGNEDKFERLIGDGKKKQAAGKGHR